MRSKPAAQHGGLIGGQRAAAKATADRRQHCVFGHGLAWDREMAWSSR
jgi:hypothetical protein